MSREGSSRAAWRVFPFLLEEGMHCAFVPPVIDVPREGTICDMRDDAKGVVVFFDTVTDANTADALVGCSVLVRRADLPEGVLELEEGGIEGFDGGRCRNAGTDRHGRLHQRNARAAPARGSARRFRQDTVLIPVVDEFLEGVDEADRAASS